MPLSKGVSGFVQQVPAARVYKAVLALLVLPSVKQTIVLALGLVLAEQAFGQPVSQIEEVVVVGSSIGVSVAEIEAQALPIDVIGNEELAQTGQFLTGDLLRNQPMFAGGSLEGVGSVGTTQSNVNLRGIGSQYTLTLIDGNRFSVNGPGNVNMIPAAALKRVEVLKAGASSIYGSDAVAGVVNFVLKDDQEGFSLSTRYGEADGWDFENYTFSFGTGNEDSSFFVLADYYTNSVLRGTDRFEFISNDRRDLGGFDARSPFNNPGVVFSPAGPVVLDFGQLGRGESSLDLADYRPYSFSEDLHDRADPCRDGGEVCRGQDAWAPTNQLSLVVSGKHEFSDATRLRGNFMHHEIDTAIVGGVSTMQLIVPADNFHNPFGTTVPVLFRPFGGGEFNDIGGYNKESLEVWRGSLTLEHDLSDNYLLTVTGNAFSQEEIQRRPNSYLIAPMLASLASTGPESVNVFCNFCNTAEQYEGIRAMRRTDRESDLLTLDARINGTAFTLASGDAQVAGGVQWRGEDFAINPSELISSGAFFDTSPNQPEDLDRSVWAVYGEIKAPLLGKVGASGSPRLELGLAVRYEDFDDVGSTFDPLISAKIQIIPDQLAARGSWNTSFRAPPLEDLAGAQDFSELRLLDPTLPGNMVIDVAGVEGGNPDLEPEDAETLSLGLIFTPEAVPGLRMSVDWWSLDQENVILAPSAQAVLFGEVPGTVVRGDAIGPGGEDVIVEAILINVAERATEGFDLGINYDTSLTDDWGLSVSFSASWISDMSAELGDGQPAQSVEGTVNSVFGLSPELRYLGTLSVSNGAFTGTLQFNYIDEYYDLVSDVNFGNPGVVVDDQTFIDLQASYSLGDGLGDSLGYLKGATLSVGVENVTDEDPQFAPGLNTFDFSFNDIRGRWWYASLSVEF